MEYQLGNKDSLVELGTVLIYQDNFGDSIKMLSKALHIRKRQLAKAEKRGQDEKHMKKEIAEVTNKIGCAYFELGDSYTAKDIFEASVELQMEVLEVKNHESSAQEMLTLAATISNIGKLRN